VKYICLGSCLRRAAAFRDDTRGNIAVIFGVTFLPVLLISGAAVDLARLSEKRSDLQQAVDLITLSLAKDVAAGSGQSAAYLSARRYLAAINRDPEARIIETSPTINTTTGEVCVTATTTVATAFMSLAQITTMPTSASGCAAVAQGTYEVALVLDTTGSMALQATGGAKIDALKSAATQFVNYMFNSPSLGPRTKMALVPFASSVKLDPATYATASFVDAQGASSWTWRSPAFAADTSVAATRFALFGKLASINSAWNWAGCFESLPYPRNVRDVAPDPSDPETLFVPLLAPDEPDGSYTTSYYDSRGRLRTVSVTDPYQYSNDYLDDQGQCATARPTGSTAADELTKQSRLCKYRNGTRTSSNASLGPNSLCVSQPLIRLQNAGGSLITRINSLTASGWTDIHEGFMWGWRSISPSAPFADGRAYDTPNNAKVIVLMTDGQNTWNALSNPINGSNYSAYGYYSNANGHLPPGNQNVTDETKSRAAMDALTLEACANARGAGVAIYTIGFSGTNDPIDQQGKDLLSACSGNPAQTFFTNSSTGLQGAFSQIGDQIGKLRLTQ
jgi:Flp pilus assembly protein TadG